MIESGTSASAEARNNTLFRGVPVSQGLAAGEVCLFSDIFDRDYAASTSAEGEQGDRLSRLRSAVENVRKDLIYAAESIEEDVAGDAGEIFRAHEMILSDPRLQREMETGLEAGSAPVEAVVQKVFRKREKRFLAMPNPMFRQRAEDVADIARRLLRELAGIKSHTLESFPVGRILVAARLYASEMVFLARRRAGAIVTETGSPGSHVAILAAAMGMPAVTQVKGLAEAAKDGDRILVDGLRGTVVLNPDEETGATFYREREKFRRRRASALERCKEPAQSADGKEITVMANVNLQGDADLAARNGADGIGLYRLEGFYFERGSLPTEDELVAEIGANLAPFAGRPVCLRLLDVGGDKQLPFLTLPTEPNPFLGRRGIRLLFDHSQLLHTQLRAFLKLSRDHDVRILVPMITRAEEMKQVRELVENTAVELGIDRLPMLGAMVETPAAALCIPELVRYADFLSIGTNDLTQYVMAADRDSPLVADYFRDDHPAVWRLIQMIAAEADGKLVAVCGRLAGNENAVPRLLQAGVGLLSVAPPLVPIIKDTVRNANALIRQ